MTEQISAEICRICGIAPIELTGCSFVNLRKYGIEEGTDVCEAVKDENNNLRQMQIFKEGF